MVRHKIVGHKVVRFSPSPFSVADLCAGVRRDSPARAAQTLSILASAIAGSRTSFSATEQLEFWKANTCSCRLDELSTLLLVERSGGRPLIVCNRTGYLKVWVRPNGGNLQS